MYEVELFHQFSSKILENVFLDRDNVDQDQTVLPVNLVDIVCQTYNFKLAVFRFYPYA